MFSNHKLNYQTKFYIAKSAGWPANGWRRGDPGDFDGTH